jgi:hypothetical protein
MNTAKHATPRVVPAALDDSHPGPLPGESYADFESRMVRLMTPHATGTPEEFREAARRYVLDFAMWLEAFLAGTPGSGDTHAQAAGAVAMPAFRVSDAQVRRELIARLYPLLKALRTCPVEENTPALEAMEARADQALSIVMGALRIKGARA